MRLRTKLRAHSGAQGADSSGVFVVTSHTCGALLEPSLCPWDVLVIVSTAEYPIPSCSCGHAEGPLESAKITVSLYVSRGVAESSARSFAQLPVYFDSVCMYQPPRSHSDEAWTAVTNSFAGTNKAIVPVLVSDPSTRPFVSYRARSRASGRHAD